MTGASGKRSRTNDVLVAIAVTPRTRKSVLALLVVAGSEHNQMNTIVATACTAVLVFLFAVSFGALASRLHPLLDLLGQFLLPAVIAAAVIVPIALLAGRPTIAIAAIAALILNLAIAWPWLHEPAKTKADGPRFKLLIFNVFVYNPRLDLVEKLVRDADADIVVLFEVVPRVRSKLTALERAYPYHFEGWPILRSDAWILSRYPLTDVSANLPSAKTPRSLAAARIAIDDRSLTLLAAHLILPFPFKRLQAQPEQADDLADAVRSVPGTRLLVGDFNAATWGASVAKQSEKTPLQALTGAGGTWPSFFPRHAGIPIDHILATPELALLSRKLMTVYGSDHRAVLAEIAFKE